MNGLSPFLDRLRKKIPLSLRIALQDTVDRRNVLRILRYDRAVTLLNGEDRARTASPTAGPKIHCVYFSCGRHFRYLALSLESLKRAHPVSIGTVYLYIDRKDPLSSDQREAVVKRLWPDALLRRTEYGMRSVGPSLLINELTAFREICQDMGSDDHLAKIDSDALFISEKVFDDVLKTGGEAMGYPQQHAITKKRYLQGGCYFFKQTAIVRMLRQPLGPVIRQISRDCMSPIKDCPEDQAMTNLAERSSSAIVFMNSYFPLSMLDRLRGPERSAYSVIHFSKCGDIEKERMADVARILR